MLDTPTGKGFFVRGDKDSCITLANPDATVTGCTRNSVLAGGKQPLMVSLDYGDYASVLVVVPDNVESVSTTASKAEKVSASGTVLLTLPSTPNALNMQTIRGETVKVDFGSPSVR